MVKLSVSVVLMAASISAFGQTAPGPWLILATGERGSINAHTTREDLVRAYGAANVVDQHADVGEGEIEPATFLFLWLVGSSTQGTKQTRPQDFAGGRVG